MITNQARFIRPIIQLGCALTCAAPIASANGIVVVAHDEWTLTTQGFAGSPTTTQFVQNIASMFNFNQPGNFRAWSNSFAVTSPQLASAMTSAGHTWTVSTAGTFDLATLQQYDGIFIVGTPIDAAVLTQYVQAGGDVYVAAGTGVNDAANLNPFLQNFELQLGALNGFTGNEPISNSSPLFYGVTSLYQANGNAITDLTPSDPASWILVTKNGIGIYAIFNPNVVTHYCTSKINSLGCAPGIGASSAASLSDPAACPIFAINEINQKQGLLFYGYAQQMTPFQDGFKCMASPTKRTPVQNSGGSPLPTNDCSGFYSFDFNAWIQGGNDPSAIAGQEIDAQYWSRDPASPSTTGLTGGLSFVIGA